MTFLSGAQYSDSVTVSTPAEKRQLWSLISINNTRTRKGMNRFARRQANFVVVAMSRFLQSENVTEVDAGIKGLL